MERGEIMRLNKTKLEIAQAKKRINPYDLCEAAGIRYNTYRRIVKGGDCKPTTAGNIAAALGVDVEELIEREGVEK